MGAVIRRAGVEDLAACAAIINEVIDETDWLPRLQSPKDIAGMFVPGILQIRTIFIAEFKEQVIGYLSATPEGNVPGFYLTRHARGRGIGKALLGEAKAAFPAGLQLPVFEPNAGARRFYAREGFVELPGGRDEATEEGVPTLLLEWRGA